MNEFVRRMAAVQGQVSSFHSRDIKERRTSFSTRFFTDWNFFGRKKVENASRQIGHGMAQFSDMSFPRRKAAKLNARSLRAIYNFRAGKSDAASLWVAGKAVSRQTIMECLTASHMVHELPGKYRPFPPICIRGNFEQCFGQPNM